MLRDWTPKTIGEAFAELIELGWIEVAAGDVYAVALVGIDGSILGVFDEDTGEELDAWPVDAWRDAQRAREERRMVA